MLITFRFPIVTLSSASIHQCSSRVLNLPSVLRWVSVKQKWSAISSGARSTSFLHILMARNKTKHFLLLAEIHFLWKNLCLFIFLTQPVYCQPETSNLLISECRRNYLFYHLPFLYHQLFTIGIYKQECLLHYFTGFFSHSLVHLKDFSFMSLALLVKPSFPTVINIHHCWTSLASSSYLLPFIFASFSLLNNTLSANSYIYFSFG